MAYHERSVENLKPGTVAPTHPLASVARVLRGARGPARVVLGYAGFTVAVTVGQVLATLITNG
jgi:hypothetical protein